MMFESNHYKLPDDRELIRRAKTGDVFASEILAERYRSMVFSVANRALGNRDDANDVTQEALVYAHQRLSELYDPKKYSSWLRQITLTLCADYRRRRKTRRLGVPLTVLNETVEEQDYDWFLTVREAIANISETQRTTLLLHYVGGWSLEEVASLLTIPVNTVRSRLMTAKRLLRSDLQSLFPNTVTNRQRKPMPRIISLPESHRTLLELRFPGAKIQSVETDIEPWQPFGPRIHLVLPNGEEKTLDFRSDLSPEKALLVPVLERLGIPGPRLLSDPVALANGYITLCEKTRGENLSLWTLGGTPHRIRQATEHAFEGIERLQGITEALLADPISQSIPQRTLSDEVAILKDDTLWNADWWLAEEGKERKAWLKDAWFMAALKRVEEAIADISDPLVYTDYTFFFPQGYRIRTGDSADQSNPLVEFTYLFGHFGDPLLGLAMVWVYDCYPFVHTGYVEQFLWRRGITQREFAPRLGLKALQMVARDLPVTRPTEGGEYWDRLRGWVDQALEWL